MHMDRGYVLDIHQTGDVCNRVETPCILIFLTVGSGSACLRLLEFGLLDKYREGQLLALMRCENSKQATAHRVVQHHQLPISVQAVSQTYMPEPRF